MAICWSGWLNRCGGDERGRKRAQGLFEDGIGGGDGGGDCIFGLWNGDGRAGDAGGPAGYCAAGGSVLRRAGAWREGRRDRGGLGCDQPRDSGGGGGGRRDSGVSRGAVSELLDTPEEQRGAVPGPR